MKYLQALNSTNTVMHIVYIVNGNILWFLHICIYVFVNQYIKQRFKYIVRPSKRNIPTLRKKIRIHQSYIKFLHNEVFREEIL